MQIIYKLIKKYNLNLKGLNILTEAASGPYLLNPFVAIAAGANKVICKSKSTQFGSAEEIKKSILNIAEEMKCTEKIIVTDVLEESEFQCVDIITNSGHLRPITKDQIRWLKNTAVIPLMWEPWEFHNGYLDINACKENDILVMGTNESEPPCDMRNYGAAFGLKLLFETGLEVAGNRVVLLGSTQTLCSPIKEAIINLGGDVIWFSSNSLGDCQYPELRKYLTENAKDIDGILFAEHFYPDELMNHNIGLNFLDLCKLNPNLKIAISCGNVNVNELISSGLHYFPKKIEPFGYMSYQSYHLGSLPVLDLFAAGLKVGEVMARARLSGLNVRDSAFYALKNSPAMDFEGKLAWV